MCVLYPGCLGSLTPLSRLCLPNTGLIDEIVELEKAMEPEGSDASMDPVKAFAGVAKGEDPLAALP